MHLLFALFFLLNGKAQAFADSPAVSRFRPELEVPSFYSLSSKHQKFWAAHSSSRDQLISMSKTAYEDLDAQKFKQAEFIQELVKLGDEEQLECRFGPVKAIRKCQVNAVDASAALLRSENLIDDVAYRVLIDSALVNDWTGLDQTTSLQKYWNKLRQLGPSKAGAFTANPYQAKRFNSKFQGSAISARQRLFLKFSYLEINSMGKLIETWLKRMNAGMALAIDYEKDGVDDERIALSEGEVETKATELYDRLKRRLRSGAIAPDSEKDASPYLIELGFNDTDLILAAVETGRVPMNVIELLSKNPAINDPAHPRLTKYLGIGKQILLAAALATPIVSAYSALALIVYKTYQGIREEKKKVSDDIL